MKFTSDGINIDYEVFGPENGFPVIFIHGFPFDKGMWDPQFYAVPPGIRAVRYDVRGHGQSETGDGQYSIEFFVDDLFKLMDLLGIQQAVLCGLSMGGYIALRAAEREPARILGLILADTKSEADNNEAKIKRSAGIRQLNKEGVNDYAADFLKNVFTRKSIDADTPAVQSILNSILQNNVLGMKGTLLALAARTDTTSALPAFNFPVLILVGEEDKITPISAAEAMQSKIPGSKLHIIPEASHLSNLENVEEFNRLLFGFLEEILTL